jgi:hypothetical protein
MNSAVAYGLRGALGQTGPQLMDRASRWDAVEMAEGSNVAIG